MKIELSDGIDLTGPVSDYANLHGGAWPDTIIFNTNDLRKIEAALAKSILAGASRPTIEKIAGLDVMKSDDILPGKFALANVTWETEEVPF